MKLSSHNLEEAGQGPVRNEEECGKVLHYFNEVVLQGHQKLANREVGNETL